MKRLALLILLLGLVPQIALAQVFAHPFQPTPAVITELDAAGQRLLERAEKLADESPPTNAVEALLQVIDRQGTALVRSDSSASGFETRWPADRYAQRMLRDWQIKHPSATKLYRQLVDRPLEEALATARKSRDATPLRAALERFGAATVGNEGWLFLGDLYLEQGQFAAATIAFEQATSDTRTDALARLALVTILRRDEALAHKRLQGLRDLAPEVKGTLAGKEGTWPSLLEALRDSLPKDAAPASMHSFDLAPQPRWSVDLPRLSGEGDILVTGRQRVADDNRALAAYFPLVVNDTVLVRQDAAGQSTLRALAWEDGRELWRFEQELFLPEERRPTVTKAFLSDAERLLPPHVGVTRYPLTATNNAIFARMGSPLTAPAARRLDSVRSKDQGWLVGLDLSSQGRPLESFPLYPSSGEWAFEGSPLTDEGRIYVLQTRRDGTRRQLHVACFARLTTPVNTSQGNNDGRARGRLLWRTLVATGDTIGGGDYDEISHGLLSRVDNILCVNSNLGAVTAVDTESGRIRWLTRYPRAPFSAEPNATSESHYLRDLAPPVITGDRVIFAPQDCQHIFACNLGSGELEWKLPAEVSNDVMQLLGVQGNQLVATGKEVVWIDLATGKISASYRPSKAEPFGRGLIASDVVLWPMKTQIHVLPAYDAKQSAIQPVRIIDLVKRNAAGGNLVLANGLVIAGGTKLYAFDRSDQTGPISK